MLEVRRRLRGRADAAGDGGRRKYIPSNSTEWRGPPGPRPSPSWCYGSAGCHGAAAAAAMCGRQNRSCATCTTSNARDAVLAWGEATEPLLDAAGHPVTRWDGRTSQPAPGHRPGGARKKQKRHACRPGATSTRGRRSGRRWTLKWGTRRSSGRLAYATRWATAVRRGYPSKLRPTCRTPAS